MITIAYNPTDVRYVFLQGTNPKELADIEKYLNKIPQYMFLPSFMGVPKPEVYLHKFVSKKTNKLIYYAHSGLWKTIIDFCDRNHIEIENKLDDKFKYSKFKCTYEEFESEVQSWNLKFEPYEYQITAAWKILQYRCSLSQLATRAGKTLIAYMVFRYALNHGAHNILMIVPSIQLVKQGVADMSEYEEFFKTETVWAKSEMCDSSNLTIGTYQSLVQRINPKSKKYDPKFYDKFDLICVDEAHHLVCDSINKILGQPFMKNVKLRFGFTGTLPAEHTLESYACHSLMGPTIQDIAAIELINENYLAVPIITQVKIQYPEDENLLKQYIECGEYLNSPYKVNDKGTKILLPKEQRKFTMIHEKGALPAAVSQIKKLTEPHEYAKYLIDLCKSNGSNLLMLEQMILHQSEHRIEVLGKILKRCPKNTIVFAHHNNYIEHLEQELSKMFPDRPIYVIKGNTTIKKRTKIVDAMLDVDNAILIASYGCCSTGITFKNVDAGIFAQSFKSTIINKQSIGRLMLKNCNKDKFYLWDMVDMIPTGKLASQGRTKARIYKQEGYDFRTISDKDLR